MPSPKKDNAAATTQATLHIPFAALFVASENARFGKPVEDVEALAALLERYGQLQPVIAYEATASDIGAGRKLPRPAYAITDGRRRLAAIELVRSRQPGRFETVEVKVIAKKDAKGAALAANRRVDLNATEEAQSFARLIRNGEDEVMIAKAFGVTERFVQQRLALAELHPPIFEALDKGEITLEVAKLYAGALTNRQASVWKLLGATARASNVKHELGKDTLRAGDALARFVGEEAYRAGGGRVELEFFEAPEESRWLDVETANQLASEALAAEAAKINAAEAGWLFVTPMLDYPAFDYRDGNLGKPRKPTAEEKKQRTTITERIAAIGKEVTKLKRRDDAEAYDRQSELQDEADNLADDLTALDTSLREYSEAARAKSGVIVSISHAGKLEVRRGLISMESAKAADKKRKGAPAPSASEEGGGDAPADEAEASGMNALTHERTGRLAALIVGHALSKKPDIALATLAGALARLVLAHDRPTDENERHDRRELLTLSIPHTRRDPDLPMPSAIAADIERDRKHYLLAFGGKWHAIEATVAAWPQSDQLNLIAFCVGQLTHFIEPNAQHAQQHHRERLAAVGKLAGANPSLFTPGLEFLRGLARSSLDAAAIELGLDKPSPNMGKAAIAARIADAAAPQGWTPPLMRQLTGVEWKPSAEAAARGKPLPIVESTTKKTPAKKKPAAKGELKKPTPAKKAAPAKPAKKAVKKAAAKKTVKKAAKVKKGGAA